ncbi:MAG TPA: M23 family metallopeptidase [Polyangiaceae bacterium]|nr:M23 family metallopeptidase [Polyangiaceae bacterium]
MSTSASEEAEAPAPAEETSVGGEQLEPALDLTLAGQGAAEESDRAGSASEAASHSESEDAAGATSNTPEAGLGPSAPEAAQSASTPEAAPSDPQLRRVPTAALEPAERAALLGGGRARDVLLERARAARDAVRVDSTAGLGDLDDIGKAEGAATREPDLRSLTPRAPSAPFVGSAKGRLSPNWIAVFGTLLGVATVASLVALGMNLDVRLPASPATSSSATSVAVEQEAAPAPPPTAKPKRARTKVPGPWRIADAKGDTRLKIAEDRVGTDPFLKALERAGVQTAQTYRIITAMKGVRDFDRCKASDRFVVLIERGSSKVKAFEYIANPEEVYQAREGEDGLLKGSKLELRVERNQVTGSLVYDGKSFDASAEQGGFDRGLAKAVSKALDGHMALDELDRGSRLRVIAQEVTVLGEFARYSGIEALEIRSPDSNKPPFKLYYFASGAERGYFDAEGHSPYEGGWRKPIPDAAMTSPYNLKRMHPILHKVMPHLGIDFGAAIGTPVGAANYGTVEFASYLGPTGNLVRIAHPGGIETGYAHLSRFAEGLKVGDKVKRQQLIGYVGSTGRSTGPHLHFSARKNGDFIDPASLNLDSMRTLSKENREAFAKVKAKYDAALEAIALPEPLAPAVASAAAAPVGSAAGEPTSAAIAGSAQAAVAPASSDPAQGDDDDETPAGAAPTTPAGATKPSGKPGSAVYLSDKELLKLQGATDEGEVAE